MTNTNELETFWINGNEARYTGASHEKYGATWYEFIWLEGSKVGQPGVTQRAPVETAQLKMF